MRLGPMRHPINAANIPLGALFAIVAVLALARSADFVPARAAAAPTGFDGIWIIDASASSLFCPVSRKKLVALVQGGGVTKVAVWPDPTGGVALVLKLERFGVVATVRGRLLARGAVVGDWSSNSVLCARGDWRAHAGN
jgi:hypothetical protein